ncbi:MAG: LPS assembly protein LptD, partial [Ghiorsea sp.]
FLMPTVAQGSRRGLEITAPFYWAASPSWDMTLSPRWMDVQGLMGEVEWRHRSAVGAESFQVQSVFDQERQTQRSRVRSDMQWQFDSAWQANIDADWVSDGFFVADFPQLDELESLAYVTSNASVGWVDKGHSATLSSQYQQRLGSASNASTLQILPRLQTAHRVGFADGKRLNIQQQTTLFRREVGVSGWRVGVKPEWQQPWSWLNGAVTSKWILAGQAVGYDAQETTAAAKYAALASSLEMEMAMERVSSDKQWRHEIKPVLRIDVSSVSDQDAMPLYDSVLLPLSMGNLLYGNRYSGWDRYERMQRLSMLLKSSLQHKSDQGEARTVLQAQLGLAWDGLHDKSDATLNAKQQRSVSNLLAELVWLPASAWRVALGGQHDPDVSAWVESHMAIGWSDDGSYLQAFWQQTTAEHSLAAESMNVSGKIQMNKRWSTTLSSQYDVLRTQLLQANAGVAYDHACWDISLEAFQSYQIGSERLSDVGVRFLLAFDGLGSVGG